MPIKGNKMRKLLTVVLSLMLTTSIGAVKAEVLENKILIKIRQEKMTSALLQLEKTGLPAFVWVT